MFTRPGGRFGVSFPTGKSFESSGIFPCVSRYADMLDLHGFISEISMNIVYGYLTGWIWYIWSSWFSYPDQHTIYTLYSYYMYIYSNIYIYPNIYICIVNMKSPYPEISNGQFVFYKVSSFQHGLDFESPAFPLILRDVSCQRRDMGAWICWV